MLVQQNRVFRVWQHIKHYNIPPNVFYRKVCHIRMCGGPYIRYMDAGRTTLEKESFTTNSHVPNERGYKLCFESVGWALNREWDALSGHRSQSGSAYPPPPTPSPSSIHGWNGQSSFQQTWEINIIHTYTMPAYTFSPILTYDYRKVQKFRVVWCFVVLPNWHGTCFFLLLLLFGKKLYEKVFTLARTNSSRIGNFVDGSYWRHEESSKV